MIDLQGALQELYGLERRKAKLGLEGTQALLAALGDPHRRFRAVHVAGTNGKGSVCALVERVLRAVGVRTGLFTSPHLVDFRERIRVLGQWADEARLGDRLEYLKSQPQSQGRTFFEVCTALAFDDFAARGVEWAVVEVGLGGRLDTTNVIRPTVAVVSRIDLDHTEILGETIEAVAAEKAGIVKSGVPVISGAGEPEAAAVVERVAAERGAPHLAAGERVRLLDRASGPEGVRLRVEASPWGRLDLACGLRGSHQIENVVVALATLSRLDEAGLRVPSAAVREGIAAARWPGRLEPCPDEPRLWWDGAHNPAGSSRLARAWREDLGFAPPEVMVFAASRDKDAAAMMAALRAMAPQARLIVTGTRNERAAEPETLAERAVSIGWAAGAEPTVASALRRGLATAGSGRVLLSGSLFAVGEAMEAFGGAPGEWM